MGEHPVQVTFMLDTRCTKSSPLSRHRYLCLACTRILLYLACFPNKAQLKCIKWKYVFFNGRGPAKIQVPHFLELNLSCIENMFKELLSELVGNVTETKSEEMSVSVLYSALIDVVQGSTWDTPDIFSPPKERCGGAMETELLNVIFVCSHWPEEIDHLAESLFPQDLSACLSERKINVFWFYEGDPTCNTKVCTIMFPLS